MILLRKSICLATTVFGLFACAGTPNYSNESSISGEGSSPALEMFVYPDIPGSKSKRSRSYGHKLYFPLYEMKVDMKNGFDGGD